MNEVNCLNQCAKPLDTIAWATVAEIATQRTDQHDLQLGASHDLNFSLSGMIDGLPFEQQVEAVIAVDSSDEQSKEHPAVKLVAALLSRLNQVTRAKVLRELPAELQASDNSHLDDCRYFAQSLLQQVCPTTESPKAVVRLVDHQIFEPDKPCYCAAS